MTYIIGQACVDVLDASCIEACPVDCIHFEKGVDRKLYIDADECIDCAACEPACPVEAIFAEDDLPLAQEAYREIEALYFQDKAAARLKLDEIQPRGGAPGGARPLK
ncbi:MAG: ferredoxin family protein [Deltaproteobacteria bacterium]|nr:ferredoxin family protein [Deltaproteobacteria bacterium]